MLVAIRYDDNAHTLRLSVHDLLELGGDGGHLRMDLPMSSRWRLDAGRAVHTAWQGDRGREDVAFRAEVSLTSDLASGDWTATVYGRIDGLSQDGDRPVVEEVKSTALGSDRLFATTTADWGAYTAQLDVYLWLVARTRPGRPVGRLVFVSLLDGSRHVLGVEPDLARIGAWIQLRVDRLRIERERRIAWMGARRARPVPWPHPTVRAGQRDVAEAIHAALSEGRPALVQAPTGFGKTACVLDAAVRVAQATDRQVFWATARNTQQRVLTDAVARLASAGLRLTTVVLGAKERVCLNDRVACRPETCRHANGYWERVWRTDAADQLLRDGAVSLAMLRDRGAADVVCPHALGLDVGERCDVVVGDYNYAFDPHVRVRRFFGEDAGRWLVVADEAHGLVERARGYLSPSVDLAVATAAVAHLSAVDPGGAFHEWAAEARARIVECAEIAEGDWVGGEALVKPSVRLWTDLADRSDELAFEYLARHGLPGDDDPYVALFRAVRRFAEGLAAADPGAVSIVGVRPGEERVRMLCLDPSTWLGPELQRLGGLVLASATLSPPSFYTDLLGLPADRTRVITAPVEHRRRVIVVPRVSTAFRDREREAAPTAEVLSACLAAIPGNAAVYFPSFQMLDDLGARLVLGDRQAIVQTPGMSEAARTDGLARLASGGRSVLLAVLGGIFAEGIDLPPGALSGVLVCGPALPPIGLERDLLRAHYDVRFGEGFRYASLVPGLTRVVQASGRLHRRPEDRGVIVLIDRRFRWRDVKDLLPPEWDTEIPDDPAAAIAAFFAEADPR